MHGDHRRVEPGGCEVRRLPLYPDLLGERRARAGLVGDEQRFDFGLWARVAA
ncbi:MAG: hypothetical protein WKH64_04585 [Chloroflexia bacterium]